MLPSGADLICALRLRLDGAQAPSSSAFPPHVDCHEPSVIQPLNASVAVALRTLTMRAPLHTNARPTDDTSRSECDDPVCRPIRLFAVHLACAGSLWEQLSGPSRQRGIFSGRIRGPQASRFRGTFQVLFWRGPMLNGHAPFRATFLTVRARGLPVRSVRGGDGSRPAAARSAVTARAWPAPSSTTSAPPSPSNMGAMSASLR